jgi:soluble lytic murein transglycosylase-like protein
LRPNVPVGKAGEIGVMQVRPETAKALGVDLDELEES